MVSDPLPEDTFKRLYKSCEKTAGMIKDEVVIDTNKAPVKNAVEQIMGIIG